MEKAMKTLIFLSFILSPIICLATDSLESQDILQNLEEWAAKHYAKRYEGTEELNQTLHISASHIRFVPHRKEAIAGEKPVPADQKCPFEKISDRNIPTYPIKGLGLDFLLAPNTYPYLENHLLLISQDHIQQTSLENSPNVLDSILAFHEQIPNRKILFNHKAGNSLEHFHVHLSTSHFPVEDLIKENPLASFSSFNFSPCMRGFYFRGEKQELSSKLFSFLKEKVSAKAYYYNLLFLPLIQDENNSSLFIHQVLVSVRKDPKLLPPSLTSPPEELHLSGFSPGSSDINGLLIVYNNPSDLSDSKKEMYDQVLSQYCEEAVISPRQLISDQ